MSFSVLFVNYDNYLVQFFYLFYFFQWLFCIHFCNVSFVFFFCLIWGLYRIFLVIWYSPVIVLVIFKIVFFRSFCASVGKCCFSLIFCSYSFIIFSYIFQLVFFIYFPNLYFFFVRGFWFHCYFKKNCVVISFFFPVSAKSWFSSVIISGICFVNLLLQMI